MTPRGSELARKLVHMAMGGFALLLRWLTWPQAAVCALAALLFNLFVLHTLTRKALLRDGERERSFSSGIVLYPTAVLALVLVFRAHLELAAGAWALLAFGDGMATVAGRSLGGSRLSWNAEKTWSGFLAFVFVGTASSAFVLHWVRGAPAPRWGVIIAGCLAASIAAAFAESLPDAIDDNISVPFVGGATLYAASLVDPDVLSRAADEILRNARTGLAVNVALALLAYASRGVRISGAVWGAVLGTLLYAFAGWRGFLMLFVFFVLGTATTRAGWGRKAALGLAQEKGGRRGAAQAFANSLAGVVFAFLSVATPDAGGFLLALVAAFATAAADTVSSEIGQAYGRRTYLVTTFGPVPAGTNGAVSVEGTVSGLVASALIGTIAWRIGLITGVGVVLVVVAAFIGTTVESFLGATLARRIDNEVANITNTFAGGVSAIVLQRLFRS